MMEQHAFPVIDLRATGANILRLRKERGLTVRDLQAYFGFEAPQAIVFLFMAIHRFSWKNSCLNRREAARD